jgi:hypothetical protein
VPVCRLGRHWICWIIYRIRCGCLQARITGRASVFGNRRSGIHGGLRYHSRHGPSVDIPVGAITSMFEHPTLFSFYIRKKEGVWGLKTRDPFAINGFPGITATSKCWKILTIRS